MLTILLCRGVGESSIVKYFMTPLKFAKNSGKYVSEKKLRVVLISPFSEVIQVNGNSEKGLPEKTLDQIISQCKHLAHIYAASAEKKSSPLFVLLFVYNVKKKKVYHQ